MGADSLHTRISGGRITGHNITPRSGEGSNIHAITNPRIMKGEGTTGGKPLSKNHIYDIQNNINNISFTNTNPYHSMYRFAISIDEPIVQFMVLYLILYEKFKNSKNQNSQTEVDKAILSIAPSTPTSISSETGKNETIYTKLRNQLSHYRNTPPDTTRREIINYLYEFRNIVHKAVI